MAVNPGFLHHALSVFPEEGPFHLFDSSSAMKNIKNYYSNTVAATKARKERDEMINLFYQCNQCSRCTLHDNCMLYGSASLHIAYNGFPENHPSRISSGRELGDARWKMRKYWHWWLQHTSMNFRRSSHQSPKPPLNLINRPINKLLKELTESWVPPKLPATEKSDNSLVGRGPKDPVCFRDWGKVHSSDIRVTHRITGSSIYWLNQQILKVLGYKDRFKFGFSIRIINKSRACMIFIHYKK